jgi:REP-associated tyrosine transposase
VRHSYLKVIINHNKIGGDVMARPLRIEYPNACYHVMNRGDNRRIIFEKDDDYRLFLDRLANFSEIYNVQIIAYCLMPNHFHLYIKTPEGNLSRFMQSLSTSFTSIKNQQQKTSGHLFQGRYKALIVEDKLYSQILSRYIHLNPIRMEKYHGTSLSVKRKVLRGYKWSSYPAVIGLQKSPTWLYVAGNYKWEGTTFEKQNRYATLIEEKLTKEPEDYSQHIKAQVILGSDRFVEKLKRRFINFKEHIEDCPQAKKMSSFHDIIEIASIIATYYDVEEPTLLAKGNHNNEARQALIYFSERCCRGKHSLSKLANTLNLSVGGYSSCRRAVKIKIEKTKAFTYRINEIKRIIENVKC